MRIEDEAEREGKALVRGLKMPRPADGPTAASKSAAMKGIARKDTGGRNRRALLEAQLEISFHKHDRAGLNDDLSPGLLAYMAGVRKRSVTDSDVDWDC